MRSSNRSHTHLKPWTLLAIAASVAVVPLLAGCDNAAGKADKKVLTGVSTVQSATNVEDGTKNIAALDALTKEADTSTARKALAKAALAGAELDNARLILRDVQDQELLISRKVYEMEQVAAQLVQTKVLIDAAARRNPAVALPAPVEGETVVSDAIKNLATGAREGEIWVKADAPGGSLATVSAVKQQISTLEGKISAIKGNIETLTKQREQLLKDAAKAQADSEAVKGDESVKAYTKGADLRKQGALTGIQIEAAQASLVPLTQDLAAAKKHEEMVSATATSFDAAGQTYTDEYAKIKAQIDKMNASAKSMMDGDKDSLKSKAIELNTLMTSAAESRAKAIELTKSAIAHFGDAVTESEKVKSENKREVQPGSPDESLIKALNAAHEASSLRIRQAEASANLAATQSAYALLLSRKERVMKTAAEVAAPLSLTVPAELTDPKNADLLKETRTSADEAYKSADESLQNVAEGATSPPKTRTSAKIARAVVNAGWSQLAAAAGDTGNATSRLGAARGYQKEAVEDPNGVLLPAYLSIITETSVAPAAPPKPAEPKPAEPMEPKSAEPTEPKPTEPTEPKPAEPTEPKPAEPTEPKSAEPKPAAPVEQPAAPGETPAPNPTPDGN